MTDDESRTPAPRRLLRAGGHVDRFSITLGIHGDEIDPDAISRVLGCAPTRAHRKGDPRKGRSAKAGPWKRGAWLLRVEGDAPRTVDDALAELLGRLPDDDGIWSELTRSWTVRIGFGLFLDEWNRGFDLKPTHVQRLARMMVEVDFDIYATPNVVVDE